MNNTLRENVTGYICTINETQSEIIYSITITSQIINGVIAILTTIFNSCMLRVLQISRPKISRVIYGQLMSICISDLIAGLTPATACLSLIDTVNRGSKSCAALIATYDTAQYAVILNISALSIRRWLVLRKATQPSESDEKVSVSILITICAWLVSLIFCFSRTFVTITDNLTVNGCLSPYMFTNEGPVNSVIVTYAASVVLLNVFYIYSAIILKRIDNPTSSGVRNNRQRIQKRAFLHLLAVLMVTNATMVPTVIFPIILQFLGTNTPELRYNLTHIQALNSLINPLLYTAHIKEIRTTVTSALCACRGRKSNHSTTGSVQEQSDKNLNVSSTPLSTISSVITIPNE